MAAVKEIIGDLLVNSSGQTVESSSITDELSSESSGKRVLGLYFSAHWCPPCRDFTPVLVEFYNQYKKSAAAAAYCLVDIVFISSDHDEESFLEYLKQMPWPAIPYDDRVRKLKLSKRYRVKGTPVLVFVDADSGSLITDGGRQAVTEDPEGHGFPWFPEPLSTILYSGPLLRGTDEVDSKEALLNKVKGIYFSAHWCPPCKVFTPTLVSVYQTLTAAGRNFEVVYVGSDRTVEYFTEYFSSMPWLAIPYGDARHDKLTKHFTVKGIPTLILLDENDEVITTDGRSVILKDHEGKNFPWPVPPFEELSESNAKQLNEMACMILFTDGKPELVSSTRDLMSNIATQYREERKLSCSTPSPLPELHFFYEGPESADVVEQLHAFIFTDTTSSAASAAPRPRAIILDIPSQQFYAVMWPDNSDTDPITETSLKAVIEDFKTDKLPFVQFEL